MRKKPDYEEFWDRLEARLRHHKRNPSWPAISWNILLWAALISLILLAFAIATGVLV